MQTEKISKALVDAIKAGNSSPVAEIAEQFGLSRQAISKYMKQLVRDGGVSVSGRGKSTVYELVTERKVEFFSISEDLEEYQIWADMTRGFLDHLANNERLICQHGFTEMLNNAKDHSEGTEVMVQITWNVRQVSFLISDNGVGIFEKVTKALALTDPRQSLLELAKGKFTTDKNRHSGEGIFFTSRMFDEFTLMSGNLSLFHNTGARDWLIEDEDPMDGTVVAMTLQLPSVRTTEEIFSEYIDDHSFAKTCVPLTLARYGQDELVSRSQAKRVLARVDKFRTVILDFSGVESVGQAFTDEIFRVYAKQHPEIELIPICTSAAIQSMILRAIKHEST